MTVTPALSDRLRAETREAHDAVEQAKRLRQIFDADFSIASYAELLLCWQSFFEAFEPELIGLRIGDYEYRSRVKLLRDDAAALARHVGRDFSQPTFRGWVPSSPEQAVGACYVIEGSCLGARLISRRLKGHFGDRVTEVLRFYSLSFSRWSWFRGQLDRMENNPSFDIEATIFGAKACFSAIESHMN